MKISYQLYSSRENPPLSQTMAMLAKAGYDEVEGWPMLYQDLADAKDTAALCRKHNLPMKSAHFMLEQLRDDACVQIAQELGIETVFCPYLMPEDRPADAAGWREIGASVAQAGQKFLDAGISCGWHNHDFEFNPLPDGSMPIDHLLQAGQALCWEIDVAWVLRGNADPAEYIREYANRITAVHIKDQAAEGACMEEDNWADVGQGTIDWPALKRELDSAAVLHWVLEHDKPSDDVRFATRSIEAVRSW